MIKPRPVSVVLSFLCTGLLTMSSVGGGSATTEESAKSIASRLEEARDGLSGWGWAPAAQTADRQPAGGMRVIPVSGGKQPVADELSALAEENRKHGEDRYLDKQLAGNLGLGWERWPIKYLTVEGYVHEFCRQRGESQNGAPVKLIFQIRYNNGTEGYYFLTDVGGKLQAAVHAEKGKGFDKVGDISKVDAIFQAEKQYWLKRYGLAPGR